MVALGLFLAVTCQSPLDRKLSPDFTAMPAQALVRDLQETTGVALEVAPPMASEIVMLKGKDIKLSEAMDRLANVLHGKWFQTEHGYLLKRPIDVQRDLEARDREFRTLAIQEQLDIETKRIASLKTPESRAEAVFKAWERIKVQRQSQEFNPEPHYDSPADQLLIKLANLIGAKELSRSEAWERVVWANKPNAAQRGFPRGYQALFDEYRQTEELLKSLSDVKGPTGFDSYLAPAIFGAAHSTQPFDKVIFSYMGRNTGGACTLWLYRADGRIHSFASRPFRFGQEWVNGRPIDKSNELERLKLTGKAGKAQLGPLAAEVHAFIEKDYEALPLDWIPMDRKLSAEAEAFLTQPETREPLSLAVADGVGALAEARGKMLAACLTDDMYRIARRCSTAGSVDLAQFESLMQRAGQMDQRVEGNWLLLTPKNPYRSETDRLGRAALGKAMRSALADGAFSFKSVCRMRYEGGSGSGISTIRSHYERLFTRAGIKPFPAWGGLGETTYFFLGSLTDDQWRLLEKEERLDCGNLSPQQRKLAKLSVARFYKIDEDPAATQLADIWCDPTESIPQGPHKGAFVVMKRKQETLLMDESAERPYLLMARSLKDMAAFAASLAHDQATDEIQKVLTAKYRTGSRTGYTVDLKVLPGMTNAWEVYAPKKVDGRAVSYADLPEDLRKELQSEFVKSLKEYAAGGTGSK